MYYLIGTGREEKGFIQKGRNLLLTGLKGKSINRDAYTHREKAIAHNIKVELGISKPIPTKDQKPQGFKEACYSLNPRTTSRNNPYREPKINELQNVIIILEDCPLAKEKATQMLANMSEGNQ